MTPSSSGDETRDALAAVLDDQVERQQRRNQPPPPRKDRSGAASKLVIPLAAITLWFVIAPPSFLRPTPAPEPTFGELRNGLRMDIFLVASQVVRYREDNGRFPDELVDAMADPSAAAGLTYLRLPNDVFEISGIRAGQVVVYRSTQSLSQFVASARAAIRQEPGS